MQTSVCRMCREEFVAGAEVTPSGWRFGLTRALRYYFLFGVLLFILWGFIVLLVALTSGHNILLKGVLLVILVVISGLVVSIPRKSRFGRDGYEFYCPACIKRTSIHLWQRTEPRRPHRVAAPRGEKEVQ